MPAAANNWMSPVATNRLHALLRGTCNSQTNTCAMDVSNETERLAPLFEVGMPKKFQIICGGATQQCLTHGAPCTWVSNPGGPANCQSKRTGSPGLICLGEGCAKMVPN